MFDRFVRDFEECDCECHATREINHFVPCCHACQYCGKRIRGFSAELHEASCPKNPENKDIK